ncbi:T29M8.11 [Citrus sinensis]|uniref:uncharacterized protein LOC102620154 n=1 Tax=Citrus sinensis TaxID=2711 RepID=UPI0003D78134|nr:uncharacterized protein LOC102620154 [Citrus sinensis]KAH9652856.1 T29M8.11 [Citrus sinensis]GAY37609.1 hypothetical protein CUMW_030340 [Citrus unshiu]
MEGLQKFFSKIPKNGSSTSGSYSSSSSSSLTEAGRELQGMVADCSSSEPVIIARGSRQVVSLWTCSKLCTFFFVAGVFVGYTLKRRVRSWASKLLRKLRDD